jgi:hypothetical protein
MGGAERLLPNLCGWQIQDGKVKEARQTAPGSPNRERWPSGLRRTLGKRVYRKVPWVRIPLSPPSRELICRQPHKSSRLRATLTSYRSSARQRVRIRLSRAKVAPCSISAVATVPSAGESIPKISNPPKPTSARRGVKCQCSVVFSGAFAKKFDRKSTGRVEWNDTRQIQTHLEQAGRQSPFFQGLGRIGDRRDAGCPFFYKLRIATRVNARNHDCFALDPVEQRVFEAF